MTSTPADDELIDLLERFTHAVQTGNHPAAAQLLQQHPDLQNLFDCVTELETLVPARAAAIDLHATWAADPSEPHEDAGGARPEHAFPRAFGRYELLAEVGRGGMGVVFRARQTDLGRVVALKMILSSQLASPDEVRRFHREAEAAGRLRHPHIVAVHEVGEFQGQHYFSMDYVEGSSLAEVLAGRPLDPETAARCLLSVARAVEYLHQHQIIHRDLKPSNILIDDAGEPYLTDFGLAKLFDDDDGRTRSGCIIGTPSYMAPEQAAGRTAEISYQSDVYSLGAILYEMLTGRPPFRERTGLDTLVQVLEGEPTLPTKINPSLPAEVQQICLRCLEKKPSDRYPSAVALADELERFLKHEPVHVQSVGLWPRLRRWLRREPALISHWAMLLISAVILLINLAVDSHGRLGHVWNLAMLGIWAVVSYGFQKLSHQDRFLEFARYGWLASDTILLTCLIALNPASQDHLLIGYPLLIAAAGLFFQVRLVSFTTALTVLAYVAMQSLMPGPAVPLRYPLIFGGGLLVLGFMIGYQVYRVRILSRYFDLRGR